MMSVFLWSVVPSSDFFENYQTSLIEAVQIQPLPKNLFILKPKKNPHPPHPQHKSQLTIFISTKEENKQNRVHGRCVSVNNINVGVHEIVSVNVNVNNVNVDAIVNCPFPNCQCK